VRRFLRKFSFLPVILILAGFVVGTVLISKPPKEQESLSVVTGIVHAAPDLRPDAPLTYFAALNPGRARLASEAPEFPLDDAQTDEGESFELVAEPGDGKQFWVLARVETAMIERWCKVVELPPVRRLEDGTWVEAETGKPLAPLDITVDRTTAC
jgi:hypothetical protein